MLADLPNVLCCNTDNVSGLCPRCADLYSRNHQQGAVTNQRWHKPTRQNTTKKVDNMKHPFDMSNDELRASVLLHQAEVAKRMAAENDDDEEEEDEDDEEDMARNYYGHDTLSPQQDLLSIPSLTELLINAKAEGSNADVADQEDYSSLDGQYGAAPPVRKSDSKGRVVPQPELGEDDEILPLPSLQDLFDGRNLATVKRVPSTDEEGNRVNAERLGLATNADPDYLPLTSPGSW